MDISLFNDPNFKVGQGTRGLKHSSELLNWNPNIVYINCLNCSFTWEIDKFIWLNNIPEECLNCHTKSLSHEYIILNSLNELIIAGKLVELKDYSKALIYRLVKSNIF